MKKLFFLSFLPISASTSYCLDETIYMHAHRGESSLAPENTVESIKLAFELGARMIETDFIMTKSGTIICVHNRKELLSVWGIDKDPADLTDEEIANARLAHPEKYDKKYANCRIPTIDDMFAAIPKDKSFELEIKSGYSDKFADMVEAARIKAGLDYKNILVTCFSSDVIKKFKKRYPLYETLYIVSLNKKKIENPDDLVKIAKNAGASQVAFGNYKLIDRAFVKKFQDAGLKVGVWQVNSLSDLVYAKKLGVNRICSDYASRIRDEYNTIKATTLK